MFHGIRVTETPAMLRGLAIASTAVIGLIATADDADAVAFPLNQPVLITDIRSALSDAGEEGTLARALSAIIDQTTPVLVVVRVAEDVDPLDQNAAVIGAVTDGIGTGMQALLAAEAQLGVRPRILGAPGLDTQPVTEALVAIAQQLRGFVYAHVPRADVAACLTYRELFTARELMLIWPEFSGGFSGDAVARAMGLRAKIDEQTGWHKTLSNITVNGVTGLNKHIHFDLTDPTTTAATLNDGDITTMVRLNGYRFWGNRTTSDNPIFAFESRVRTSQALQDMMVAGLAWAVDRPLTPQLVRDLSETINAEFRALKAAGKIIGGQVLPIDTSVNTAAFLASGKLALDYEFTDAAPAESINLTQRVTDRFYADFAAQVSLL